MRLLSAINNWLVLDESDNARNKDIVPIPVHRRRWKLDGFVSYWAISSMCAVTWAGGSSIMYMGLTGGQTMGVIVVGNLLISVSALVNSIYGTKYHIGYSVFQRVVFGVKGSVVGVLVRSILSVVWFAYQAWLGGLCVNIVLSSWSQSYLNMTNTLPDSVPMTTQELIGYIVYLLISVPVLMVPPEYYSPFLASGSLCIFFIGIGITAWAVVDNGNSYGTMMTERLGTSGSMGWAWVYGINSWYSSLVAGISNQSDYSRFNKKEWHSHLGILVGCNVAGFIVPLFGIVTASALAEKYGQEFWMPNDICMFWLQQNYTAKARAAAFFCGVGLTVSQLGVNCVGNAISGGMDLASVFPRYLNIRRGAILCLLLSWPTQPWLFFNSSSTFLTVMSSFSVFITPLVAVYLCEFFIVRKGIIKLSDCYVFSEKSIYWYTGGVNWRSLVSFVCGSAPGLPGLINAANPNIAISAGAMRLYYGSFIFQFAIALAIHYFLTFFFRVPIGERDLEDYFDTYSPEECARLGMIPYAGQVFEGEDPEFVVIEESK